MYTLSKPQKILATCGTVAFIFTLIVFALIAWLIFQDRFNNPIQVKAGDAPQSDAGQNFTGTIKYGERINQNTGTTALGWGDGNVAVLFPGSNITITPELIRIDKGEVLLQIGKTKTLLQVGDNTPELAEDLLLFDTATQTISLLKGKFFLPDQYEAGEYTHVNFTNPEITGTAFTRELFTTEAWQAKIGHLTRINALPTILSDVVPPQLQLNGIEDNYKTDENKITISGTTDRDAELTINNTKVEHQAGEFAVEFELIPGANTFKIVAADKSDNTATKEITIVRTAQRPACVADSLAEEVLCQINDYRTSNGLGEVTMDSQLTVLATAHSEWMLTNNTVAASGPDEPEFNVRCTAGNTTCSAQNIAFDINQSASEIFQTWLNSVESDQAMLGNFTVVGIGDVDGYITALFR